MAMRPEEVVALIEKRLKFQYISHSFTGAGADTISHNLKRTPLRWVVVKKDANVDIYGTDDEQNLYLTSTGSATVTLEII